MALELAIVCAVAGAVLGLRYNVLVLVPTVTFAMALAVIIGIARADSFWSIVLLTAALGAAVQMGYLAGITIYAVIASIRSGRGKDRNHELSAARGPAWSQTWPPTWPQMWRMHAPQLTPSAIARLHPLQPPQG